MFAVGLTGGIGSGKTMVAQLFESLDVPVFYADDEAKKMYDTNSRLREQLENLLGSGLYKDGRLQRSVMAARIFADKVLLEKVNRLVHPLLDERFRAYAAAQHAPYVMMEAAILFESGFYQSMQATVAVTAPEVLRIQRVMQRDNISAVAVRRRMRHQWPDEQRNTQADFVITNDGEKALLPQVIRIHEELKLRTKK